ncbi:Rieske (2Fe-2S) protein [Maioricimonas rarisocia]|nr:Rieske (2Fe-2S) protein [Maioricimonas rarisocia]
MPTRHPVASISDIPPGSSREVVAGDRVLAIFNVSGEFHALDGICPHAGGPLGDGTLSGGVVTCPWHGWQFDVTTGQHCLSPGICQTRYPVSVEGDQVVVELPDGND